MIEIGIIDCGISNVGSVQNAFAVLGIPTRVVHVPDELASCSHVVLPGDGSFPVGMRELRDSGLDEAVCASVRGGKPLLGICLGMQLLAQAGEEFELTAGLGLTYGRVVAMRPQDLSLPLPQIGWNDVILRRNSRLFADLAERPAFYFMQSYVFADPDAAHVAATCYYGGPFVAVIEDDNVFGVQFHPEKSQRAGLQLLRNFASVG